MDRPTPEMVDCPHCEAKNFAIDDSCSSCGGGLTLLIGPAEKAAYHLSLRTLMVLVAMLAPCFAAARWSVSLGIVLALLILPAAYRASVDIEAQTAGGRPMSRSRIWDTITLSLLAGLLLLPFAGMAFLAASVPIGLLFFNVLDGTFGPIGLIVSILAGMMAGFWTSHRFGRCMWPESCGPASENER